MIFAKRSAWRLLLLLGLSLAAAPQAAHGRVAGGDMLLAKAKKHAGPGVRVLFDAAQQLFDAGKYSDALAAYESLLRKFPGHAPAQIQLAKTLYRLDRMKDAQAAFNRVNLSDLDAETSYEYGWSFYSVKNWQNGLAGFQRLPQGHSLFDLANYYGGICAIKLKRLELAEDMLDKAVVLPDKLAKSRALYIKHVQALRLLHVKAGLAQERGQEQSNINAAAQAAAGASPPAPAPPAKKRKEPVPSADGAYHHQGFKYVSKAAQLKYLQEHQSVSDFGVAQQSYDAKVTSFDFLNGPLLPLPLYGGKDYLGNPRQGALGLQVDLGAEDRIVSGGKEQRILSDDTPSGLTRQLNESLGIKETKAGKLAGDLWLELPLPYGFWLAGGGEMNFLYYDFEKGARVGYRRGYGDLRGKYFWGNIGGEASYMEILNASSVPIVQVTGGTVAVDSELLPKLVVALSAGVNQYAYLAEGLNLDGPDSIISTELKVVQHLPLSIALSGSGSFQQQSNYIFRSVPSFPAVAADGQVFTGKASFEVTPLSFLTAGVSELISTTRWSVKNAAANDSFNHAVANYVEDFNFWAAVNLNF